MTPYDLSRFRLQQQQQRNAVPLWHCDHATYSQGINLPSLTSEKLGPQRFRFVLRCLRQALQTIAPKDHIIEATYDDVTMEYTGYRILLRDGLAAMRIRICYDHAIQGRGPPLSGMTRS
jgi:hypothetical protein